MTENRAIEILKKMKHMFTETCAKIDENTALDMAVEAIKEIQQYRAIGTVEEFKALKDAEEQGLLLRLPCKVGSTVYEISRVEPYRNPAIREMGVVDILLRDNDMYFTLQDLHDEYYDNSILSTEFGYTVFFKMEEAEQALAKMQGT